MCEFSLVYWPKVLPNQIKIDFDYFSTVLKVSSFVDLIFFLQILHSFVTILHVNNPLNQPSYQIPIDVYQFYFFPWYDTLFHGFFTFQIFILEALHSILCLYLNLFCLCSNWDSEFFTFVFTCMLYVWLSKCLDSWKSLVS